MTFLHLHAYKNAKALKNIGVFRPRQYLQTEVRGDFNIHGTKYFYNAVFHQKSKNYDVVSLPVPLVGQKKRPLHEMLTWLVITENVF